MLITLNILKTFLTLRTFLTTVRIKSKRGKSDCSDYLVATALLLTSLSRHYSKTGQTQHEGGKQVLGTDAVFQTSWLEIL